MIHSRVGAESARGVGVTHGSSEASCLGVSLEQREQSEHEQVGF